LQLLATRLFGSAAALGAISANFQAAHDDVEAAIALDLSFETVEEIAFKFHDLPATQARHVNVIALRPSLIEVFLALHVHEVEFIDQAVALEEAERAIDGNAVNSGIQFAGVPENLRGIKMLFGGFDDAKNGPPLVSKTNAARSERSLQSARCFGFGKRHK
jgi:hypothetical protein